MTWLRRGGACGRVAVVPGLERDTPGDRDREIHKLGSERL